MRDYSHFTNCMVEYLLNFPGGREQLCSYSLCHSLSDTLPYSPEVKANTTKKAKLNIAFFSIFHKKTCLAVIQSTKDAFGLRDTGSNPPRLCSLKEVIKRPQSVSTIRDNFPLWFCDRASFCGVPIIFHLSQQLPCICLTWKLTGLEKWSNPTAPPER